MKTSINFIKCASLIFAITLTSCSKDGDIGLQGEQGIQGEDGEQGPAGEDGTNGTNGIDGTNGTDGTNGEDGQDGNANVVSVTFEAKEIVIGQNIFEVPQITQDIFDSGVVLGYVTVSGNNFWETLPIVVGGNVVLDIDRIGLGEVTLTSTFDQTLDFRFIIIASSSSTTGKSRSESVMERLKKDGVDINDYYAVMDYFGLNY